MDITFRIDPQNYSLAIAFFLNAILSIVIYLNSKKKNEQVSFALLALSVSFWSLGMFMYRGVTTNFEAVAWTKFYYIFAGLIPLSFLYFSLNIEKRLDMGKHVIGILYFFGLLFVISPIFGDLIVTKVVIERLKENEIFFGQGLLVWGFYLLVYFIFGFYFLFCNYLRKGIEQKIKLQYKYIIFGSLISVMVGVVTNHILPLYFNNPMHAWVGPTSALIMTTSIAVAIFRHSLFDIKVIATELFVFALWSFILVRTITSNGMYDLVSNSILFFVTIILGILIIRSVIKEVQTRERIEALAKDLEKANVRLTDLNRQKSEFVSFATHQLRAPLTAMKGYGSLILEGDMGEVSEKVKEGVKRIFDSTKTLVAIVDDYLNVSRIELGTMKYFFDKLNLKTFVEDIIAELKPNIEKSGLKFDFVAEPKDANFTVTADKDKLKQVFANIIDNSLKYTPKGTVTVSLSRDDAMKKIVFSVKDTGVGIAPETLPHLFQKFSRAENASKTNILGTGLGLFVAKQMIEAHNGTIRAESAGEGKGSKFIVELDPA